MRSNQTGGFSSIFARAKASPPRLRTGVQGVSARWFVPVFGLQVMDEPGEAGQC